MREGKKIELRNAKDEKSYSFFRFFLPRENERLDNKGSFRHGLEKGPKLEQIGAFARKVGYRWGGNIQMGRILMRKKLVWLGG